MSEPLSDLQSAVREHIGRFSGYDFDRDHEDLRSALAASERPPVDPLREALGMCVEALYGRESVSDAIEAARAALASPAVPPEGLDEAIAAFLTETWDNRWMLRPVDECRESVYRLIAIARLSDTGDTPEGAS